jgi:predicted esterase
MAISWGTNSLLRSAPIFKDNYALPCVVSLPDVHTQGGGPWRVLCFLHGDGEAAAYTGPGKRHKDVFAALRAHGPLRPRSSLPASDFIVLIPQLPGLGGDVWKDYAASLDEILSAVKAEFNADLQHAYLSGFSYGANGVLDISDRQDGRWAALWPVDATRPFKQNPKRPPVWLWYGTDTRLNNEETSEGLLEVDPTETCPSGDKIVSNTWKGHVSTAIHAYQDRRVYMWLSRR